MSSIQGVFATSLVLFGLSAGATAPAAALTESEAVLRFLAESPAARLGALRAEAAGAGVRAGAPAPNPDLLYSVEDAGGTRDEFIVVTQLVPITGRRALVRQSADRASSAALLEAEADLRRAAHDLRSSFYEVLHRRLALDRLAGGAEDLAATVAILREREAAGDAPGYDVLRAEQELAALDVETRRARADLEGAWSRLLSFFPAPPGDGPEDLQGDFTLGDAPPAVAEAVAFARANHPDLLALAAASERREIESREARRRRLPEPSLAAGVKRVESGGESDSGYVASLTIPIPIVDRGQYSGTYARAGAMALAAERSLLESRIEADVRAAHARVLGTRETARSGAEIDGRARELLRMATVANDEGEHGILERLDAQRTALRSRLLALEARYEARRAEIDLERAMGVEVMP